MKCEEVAYAAFEKAYNSKSSEKPTDGEKK